MVAEDTLVDIKTIYLGVLQDWTGQTFSLALSAALKN